MRFPLRLRRRAVRAATSRTGFTLRRGTRSPLTGLTAAGIGLPLRRRARRAAWLACALRHRAIAAGAKSGTIWRPLRSRLRRDRTPFRGAQFTVAVPVQREQGLGGVSDFLRAKLAVLIRIERSHNRQDKLRTHVARTSRLTRFTGLPRLRIAFRTGRRLGCHGRRRGFRCGRRGRRSGGWFLGLDKSGGGEEQH